MTIKWRQGSKLTETHSTTEQQVLVAKCVTINTEGNTITEIRGYSHIDRYYKGLTPCKTAYIEDNLQDNLL